MKPLIFFALPIELGVFAKLSRKDAYAVAAKQAEAAIFFYKTFNFIVAFPEFLFRFNRPFFLAGGGAEP